MFNIQHLLYTPLCFMHNKPIKHTSVKHSTFNVKQRLNQFSHFMFVQFLLCSQPDPMSKNIIMSYQMLPIYNHIPVTESNDN